MIRRVATACLLTVGLTLTGADLALAGDNRLERRSTQPVGDPITGVVVKVQDGDSLWVRMRTGDHPVNVRLVGVAAPEHDQCYYEKSKEYVTQSLLGKTVTLRTDARHDQGEARHHTEEGEHPRTFAYVYVDGRLFNADILRKGFARERDYGPDYHLRERLLRAEQAAESRNARVWGWCYL